MHRTAIGNRDIHAEAVHCAISSWIIEGVICREEEGVLVVCNKTMRVKDTLCHTIVAFSCRWSAGSYFHVKEAQRSKCYVSRCTSVTNEVRFAGFDTGDLFEVEVHSCFPISRVIELFDYEPMQRAIWICYLRCSQVERQTDSAIVTITRQRTIEGNVNRLIKQSR